MAGVLEVLRGATAGASVIWSVLPAKIDAPAETRAVESIDDALAKAAKNLGLANARGSVAAQNKRFI